MIQGFYFQLLPFMLLVGKVLSPHPEGPEGALSLPSAALQLFETLKEASSVAVDQSEPPPGAPETFSAPQPDAGFPQPDMEPALLSTAAKGGDGDRIGLPPEPQSSIFI